MKLRNRILAGTALGLLIAGAQPAATAFAATTQRMAGESARADDGALIVAQADDEDQKKNNESREQKADQKASDAAGKAPSEADEGAIQADTEQKQADQQAAPKKEEPASAASSGEKPEAQDKAAGQEPPENQKAAEKAPAENPAQQAEENDQKAAPKKEEPAEAASGEKKPEAPEKAVSEDQKAPAEKPARQAEEENGKQAPGQEGGKAAAETQDEQGGKRQAGKEGVKDEAAGSDKDVDEKSGTAQQKAADENAPAKTESAAEGSGDNGNEPGSDERNSEQAARQGEARPENATPVLDSQKVQKGEGERAEQADAKDAKAPEGGERRKGEGSGRKEEARTGPPPKSDKAAQRNLQVQEVESATAEEGERIDRDDWRKRERRDRRDGAKVVKEIGDRFVLEINNQTIVQSSDRDRLRHRARDVYYEDLPRGRTREVIERENGARVVTIRNRYGDIVRRSRIMPDGQEYVLVYASDRGERRRNWKEWRDPGRDLPPLQLTIPASEYILEAEQVRDPDAYYQFLEEPPVEPVERLYSIDDVKYSARIRDKVRRIDLDTINFEFGSADISESEIDKLDTVASAMQRLLENNPAETFLIEGHTDAVGSDVSNLALSDERASSVASALTNVFDVPPENLVTQGYGEQYPKIDTQDRERENRRVAIRRITPLVSPVASAQ